MSADRPPVAPEEASNFQPLPIEQINVAGSTRRSFTRWVSALLGHGALTHPASSSVIGSAIGGAVVSGGLSGSKWLLDTCENRDFLSEYLFGESISSLIADKDFIVSTNNPYSSIIGRTAPTMQALADLRRALRIKTDDETLAEEVITKRLSGHTVLLGGPVANIYARQYLGWGRHSPLLRLAKADLKYRFDNCLAHPSGYQSKPDFKLRCPNGDVVEDHPGVDHLLISSFPNAHSTGFELGDRLMIFSGTHGGGTRALGHVLSQPKMVKSLPSFSKAKHIGWQCLVKVGVNDDGHPTGELHVYEPEFIDGDFGMLRTAVKRFENEKIVFPIDHNDPYLPAEIIRRLERGQPA